MADESYIAKTTVPLTKDGNTKGAKFDEAKTKLIRALTLKLPNLRRPMLNIK